MVKSVKGFLFYKGNIWSHHANFLSRNRSVKYIWTPSSRKFVSSPGKKGGYIAIITIPYNNIDNTKIKDICVVLKK